MTSGINKKVGMWTGLLNDLEHEVTTFNHGEEIVGIYGKLETVISKKVTGSNTSTQNFVSLGFILNNCENIKLAKLSSDITRQKMLDSEAKK